MDRPPSTLHVPRAWPHENLEVPQNNSEATLLSVNVKFTCELKEDDVSCEEINRWFYYLLSGLNRAYISSFPECTLPSTGTVQE